MNMRRYNGVYWGLYAISGSGYVYLAKSADAVAWEKLGFVLKGDPSRMEAETSPFVEFGLLTPDEAYGRWFISYRAFLLDEFRAFGGTKPTLWLAEAVKSMSAPTIHGPWMRHGQILPGFYLNDVLQDSSLLAIGNDLYVAAGTAFGKGIAIAHAPREILRYIPLFEEPQRKPRPHNVPFYVSHPLGAGASDTSNVVRVEGYERMAVWLYSTQDCTFDIEVSMGFRLGWRKLATGLSVSAGKTRVENLTPASYESMRIVVTMGATAGEITGGVRLR